MRKFYSKASLGVVCLLLITSLGFAQKPIQNNKKLTAFSPILQQNKVLSQANFQKTASFIKVKHKSLSYFTQRQSLKENLCTKQALNRKVSYHYIACKPVYTCSENKAVRKTLSYISKKQKNSNAILSRLYTISKRPLDIQIEDKIHFNLGEYALSSMKIKEMEQILENVQETVRKYKFENPNDRIILILEIEGYTDKVSREKDPSIRKQKNQVLSEQRATLIGKYMQAQIKTRKLASKIHLHTKGLGEQLPPNYTSPLLQVDDDPNRRICLVDVFVYSSRSRY